MNRPMFLRGPRRYLVQWYINAVEALGAIVLIAFVVVIGLAMAMKTTHLPLRPCDAPDDGQVLIWYTQNGTPVCQYVDR